MRYFFDITIAFRAKFREKDFEWWNRYALWRRDVFSTPAAFDRPLYSRSLQLFCDEGCVSLVAPYESGIERDTFDAVLSHVQRYLREVPSALPVGFTYAQIGLDAGLEYRQYGGGCIFITKDKIHELVASEQLTELQERLAKNGEF